MSKKKKVVHWSKLPRPKLISKIKALELANAKLKTQLAEARETRLLNDRRPTISPGCEPDRLLSPAEAEEVLADVFSADDFTFPWENGQ